MRSNILARPIIGLVMVASLVTNALAFPVVTPDASDQAARDAPQDIQTLQAEIAELQRRLELLAVEVERLRSGEAPAPERTLTEDRRRALGVAPSAASAYRAPAGVTFAGYGEMLFENFDADDQRGAGGSRASQLDFLRHILYMGYRFDDRFLFNAEVEIEHANEISVEFAYLDVLLNDALTIRGGMVLSRSAWSTSSTSQRCFSALAGP